MHFYQYSLEFTSVYDLSKQLFISHSCVERCQFLPLVIVNTWFIIQKASTKISKILFSLELALCYVQVIASV